MGTFLTTEDTGGTEEEVGVSIPKVGTARRAVPRFRRAAPFFWSPRPSQAGRLRYAEWDPCGEASLPFIDGRCRAGGPFRIKN